MTATPLVSIIIPVYNGADYLGEAIESALGQTYERCEIVVVNDGSTDGGATAEVARSYGNRIRYIEKENGGVATALNRGIAEAGGEYIAWLSHDDRFLPGKIFRQIEVLRGLGRDAVVYSDWERIGPAGETLGQQLVAHVEPSGYQVALLLNNGLWVHGCTVLMPATALRAAGDFRVDLRYAQDNEMWYRLSRYTDFVHLQEPLVQVREHPGQGTVVFRPQQKDESNRVVMGILKDAWSEEWWRRTGMSKSSFFCAASRGLARRKADERAAVHALMLGFRAAGWRGPDLLMAAGSALWISAAFLAIRTPGFRFLKRLLA